MQNEDYRDYIYKIRPSGEELISKERDRQISKEGFINFYDQRYKNGELVSAAIAYAHMPNLPVIRLQLDDGQEATVYRRTFWPASFDKSMYKPAKDNSKAERIKELVKAGALIAAEIDRLLNV